MKKRLLAALLVSALAVTSLMACSSKDKTDTASSDKTEASDTAKDPVKVVLNEVAHSIFYAPMYVAVEEGYFADEGIDLDLVTGFGVRWLIQS